MNPKILKKTDVAVLFSWTLHYMLIYFEILVIDLNQAGTQCTGYPGHSRLAKGPTRGINL